MACFALTSRETDLHTRMYWHWGLLLKIGSAGLILAIYGSMTGITEQFQIGKHNVLSA